MNLKLGSFIVLFSAAAAACGGTNNQEPATASTASSSSTSAGSMSAASPTDDGETQAARGAKLFAANCASCHGDQGQGKESTPPVVGKDALPLDPRPTQKYRKNQFHTAADVADFVVHNMPPKNPGSLPESDYWDILAFDLKANGVAVAGKHIDAKTAATIQLH